MKRRRGTWLAPPRPCSGRCLVGAIGAANIMMDFSPIGNVVNLASRIETIAAPGGVSIDRFTRLDVGEGLIDVLDRGSHEFKGFEHLIQVSADE